MQPITMSIAHWWTSLKEFFEPDAVKTAKIIANTAMSLEIHVYHHFDATPSDVAGKLEAILRKLEPMHEEFESLRVRLDKATTDIGARLQKLLDQISGGVSKEEATQLIAEFTPTVEQLESMGKDPANPVPTP